MTKAEVARLLTLIAAFDRRTIGDADVEAWHLVVGDLEPQDCADAVREHFASRHEWLMPAHVRTFAVTAARRREGQRRIAELEAQIAAENAGDSDLKPIEAGDPAPSVALAMREAVANRPRKPPAEKRKPDPERMKQARAEVDGVRTETADV